MAKTDFVVMFFFLTFVVIIGLWFPESFYLFFINTGPFAKICFIIGIMYHKVYLLFGGNQGDVGKNFLEAATKLESSVGRIISKSRLYKTEPWGMKSGRYFINQVLCLTSHCHPREILNTLLEIEHKMGRVRVDGPPTARPIDIDILFIDHMIVSEPGLEIPHPRLHLRRFVLQPLCEIAADLIHPIFGVSIRHLLETCDDPLSVIPLSDQMMV